MTAPSLGNAAALYTGGAPVLTTAEGCTQLSTYVWQISSAAKRAIDPATAVHVYVDAGEVAQKTGAVANWTLDYANGKITFTADETGHTVTITCKYVPLLQIVWARSANAVRCSTNSAPTTWP